MPADYELPAPERPSWASEPVAGFGPGAMGPLMAGLRTASAQVAPYATAVEAAVDAALPVVNVILDWLPVIGDVKAAIEVIAGENMLGEKLSPAERIVTALTILPLGDFLRLGKYADEAEDLIDLGRRGDELVDLERQGDKVLDLTRHTDELEDAAAAGGRHLDEGAEALQAVRPGGSLHVGAAGTLVGTSTAVFRRDAERLLRDTPDHPLKFLLDDAGHFHGTRGLDHSELIDRPGLVQMGHVGSKKAGGAERVVLQDAWLNQFDNVTIEHPSRGGALKVSAPVVDIGGVAVDLRSAQMWQKEGLLKGFDLEAAPRLEL
jgi:hypothetical protein